MLEINVKMYYAWRINNMNTFKTLDDAKKAKNWMQKAVNPKHEGYCTPMTKKTCTPRRKALARTLKKMAKKRG